MMSSTIRYSALGNCRRKRGLITDYATAVVSCQAAAAGVDLRRGSTAWRHSESENKRNEGVQFCRTPMAYK